MVAAVPSCPAKQELEVAFYIGKRKACLNVQLGGGA
jgi:hypothetical protein